MISDFAKEKVFWTRKMNLKLVKFIENRPNIWHPKHPKYTSIYDRDQTYAEFAAKYGNQFTGQAVKDRWTNIRCTFANYVRKMKLSRTRGDEEEYKVNWHLWDACQFLLTVNNKRKSSIYFEDNNKGNTNEKLEQSSYEDNLDISYNGDSKCQDMANSLLNVFRGVQNDVFDIDQTKFGKLGTMIMNRLSEMNSYEAAQMTSKIMRVLLLYNEDNPDNPNNMKVEFEY